MEGSVPEDDLVAAKVPVTKTVSEKPVIAEKPVGTMPKGNAQAVKKTDAVPKGDEVRFFVQMAASKTQLSKPAASWNVKAQVTTKHENGYYKYLAGPFADFGQANAVQKELRAGTCKDAFVVAYRGDQRITMTEATAASGK
jgi:N-acetylmuramoyl-L-alanine amidase